MAQKIIIASGKGGVGKSSLTAGLGRALSAMDKKVLMLDMDIGLRSLDLIFGVEAATVFDWGNIIDEECEPNQATMSAGGPKLITAPMGLSDSFTPEAMKKLAEKLDSGYDYILLDAPAGLSSGFELACAAADRAIVVSTADEVCVRSVNITAAGIRRSGITDVRLVINRFDEKAVVKGKLLNIDDVIDATCAQLLGIVPEDAYVSHCAVRGEKLPPLSSASRAFSRIARRVCGENVPLFG
ncbi:MAG: P-loop NTPase [Clostridia bacterium]|nr:P-loop NTPase [Clostridia bacterium]